MGLLDSLFDPQLYGGTGGLLSRLSPMIGQFPQSQGFEPQNNPIAVGGYQMPRIGNPDQFQPEQVMTPPAAQPAQGQMPQAPPQQGFGGFLQSLNENFQNMGNGGSLIGALTGQSPTNQTAQFLVSKGIDPALAKSIVADPATLRSILPQVLGFGEQKAPTPLGNGFVWNPATRKVEQVYKPPTDAEKSAQEIAGREQALRERGLDPKDTKYSQFVLSGKWPREDAQPLTATDKKAIMSAEDENVALSGTVDVLKRAKELNDKTFTGITASTLGTIGTSVPGAGYLIDEKTAKNTREFSQLMTGEAVAAMSKTLKGATTDREMERFIEILANPSTPPEIRGRTIERMLQLAERQKQINDSRINDLRGGTYYKQGGGQPQQAATPEQAPTQAQQFKEGATATNPQTGQKLTFRNGKWQ
jgi:hypothetical protein